MIGIVDYGLGNVRAFDNIYRNLGIPARPVRTADELRACDRLILPGVGAFDWAMGKLSQSGMLDALNARVLEDKVPVFGVCVGMQMMAAGSEEGSLPGLDWLPGRVRRFEDGLFDHATHLPHMGWNDVEPAAGEPLFVGIDAPEFYFLHSYYFDAHEESIIIGRTHYGTGFASAVRQDHICGTQFHPEKSHHGGVTLLRNFAGGQ